MKPLWKRAGNDEGAALVEMALSTIIFLTVLMGSFEAFMTVYSYHYISYAAREGARYAMVRGSDCYVDSGSTGNMPGCTTAAGATQADIQTYIDDLNFPGINVNDLTVTVKWYVSNGTNPNTWSTAACTASSGCNAPGNQVQVKVTYTNPLSVPFIPAIPLNLTSTSTMVISQ